MWTDWDGHLGVSDPDGMCRFIEPATSSSRTTGYDGARMLGALGRVRHRTTTISAADGARRPVPVARHRQVLPAQADRRSGLRRRSRRSSCRRSTVPTAGSSTIRCSPPRTSPIAATPARRRSSDSTPRSRRSAGPVTRSPASRWPTGPSIAAPIVVNVGGPHSSCINRLAGVTDDMTIGHRALRQEVFAAPAPAGRRLEDGAPLVSDLDVGQYFRPQPGGTLLVGCTEPECDELHWVDDPDANSSTRRSRSSRRT